MTQNKKALMVVHQPRSSTGDVGLKLIERGYDLDVRRPVMGEKLPKTMSDHDLAVIYGGPPSANDNLDYIKLLLSFDTSYIRACFYYCMADELFGSELGLAFVIVGVLLFVVEVFQPGFLIAVPATVFIALGVLLSFNIVDGLLLLPIGLAVGLGSLYGTMMLYQSLAPPDTPSEMSIEGKIGEKGIVTKEVVANDRSGKIKIGMEEVRATSDQNISVGTKVKVTDAEGITVTVMPLQGEE